MDAHDIFFVHHRHIFGRLRHNLLHWGPAFDLTHLICLAQYMISTLAQMLTDFSGTPSSPRKFLTFPYMKPSPIHLI